MYNGLFFGKLSVMLQLLCEDTIPTIYSHVLIRVAWMKLVDMLTTFVEPSISICIHKIYICGYLR